MNLAVISSLPKPDNLICDESKPRVHFSDTFTILHFELVKLTLKHIQFGFLDGVGTLVHINQNIPNFLCILKTADFVEFFGAQSVEEDIASLSIVLQHLQLFRGSFTIWFLSIEEITLQANTHNSPNGGVMSKNMHFHLMLPTTKICTIKVRTSTVVISLSRRHTLLGCETKSMITKTMEIKANGDQGFDTTCRIESRSRGGVIRLLDQIKI